MEWLFQKAIENVGESYSPQQVKQILDSHQVAIERLFLFLVGLSILFVIYILFTEIRFWKKFQKK